MKLISLAQHVLRSQNIPMIPIILLLQCIIRIESFCPLPTPPKNGHFQGTCSSVLPNDVCFIVCNHGYKVSNGQKNFMTCIERKNYVDHTHNYKDRPLSDNQPSYRTVETSTPTTWIYYYSHPPRHRPAFHMSRSQGQGYNNYNNYPSQGQSWSPQPAYRSLSYNPSTYQGYQQQVGSSYRTSFAQTPTQYNPTVNNYRITPVQPRYETIRKSMPSLPRKPEPPKDVSRTNLWSTGDHVWDTKEVPSCELITCPSIPAPVGGATRGVCNPGIGSEVCNFYCSPGYSLDGPSGIVCLPETGNWNKNPPKCVKNKNNLRASSVTCRELVYKYRNGGVFLGVCSPGRPGFNCTLNCADSYQIRGDKDGVFTCQPNGFWNKPIGTTECIQIL